MTKTHLAILYSFLLLFIQIVPGISQTTTPVKSEVNIGIAPLLTETKGTIVADFEADYTLVETGSAVQFTNLSTGDPTFFQWTIPGATPAITYVSEPLVIYHTPGIYNVTLYVSGLNGNDEITKENYIEVIEPISNLPDEWEYPTTLSQHVLTLPITINPRVFNIPIDTGDYIGVFFFDNTNQLKCAGAVEWIGDPTSVITAQGDSYLTPDKDGFDTGETFNWKIFSVSKQEEYPATPTYSINMPDYFYPYGFSSLTDLYAGVVYEITKTAGWCGFSSPVLPWNNDLATLFTSNLSDINIMYGDAGIFWPENNINTIESWESTGYFINLENASTFTFKGYPLENLSLSIQSGWNLLPVQVSCQTEISVLLQNNLDKVEILKDIAGINMFWPEHSIYTLTTLIPGQAYLLKANDAFILEFSPCEN